jgi:uncharacterized short protein YbdD (DUF466 family)
MSTQTATLTFDLTDHHAERQLRLALNASRMMFALQSFDRYLRTHAKHSDEPPDIHEIRQEFHALLSAEDINIHE